MTQYVDVEIYADIICPWCYIGKKRFSAFAALYATRAISGGVFCLIRNAYWHGSSGLSDWQIWQCRQGRLWPYCRRRSSKRYCFNFDGVSAPDSHKTHRYLLAAAAKGQDLSDAFFKAYFIDGRDIGDDDEVAKIAHEQGFSIDAASLADPALDRQIANDIEMSRQLRVDGVPFMIFAGQYAVPGAHIPQHLIPAIDGCLSNRRIARTIGNAEGFDPSAAKQCNKVLQDGFAGRWLHLRF